MKKSLLLTAMAAVTLSAAAQGVDPVQYTAGNGYQLENIWLMSRGDGSNGVALADFEALPFGNTGKGVENVKKFVETAVGSDILFSQK